MADAQRQRAFLAGNIRGLLAFHQDDEARADLLELLRQWESGTVHGIAPVVAGGEFESERADADNFPESTPLPIPPLI